MPHGIGPNSPQRTVPERWGYPFWDVVKDFADQGLCRAEVAKAIGYTKQHFGKLLADNPEHDPFEPYGVPSTYVKDTGEGFRDALLRMQAAGYSLTKAAHEIGYSSYQALQYAMDVRGITLVFKRPEPERKAPKAKRQKMAPKAKVGGEHPWRRDARLSMEINSSKKDKS